jgi:hypothetical protein
MCQKKRVNSNSSGGGNMKTWKLSQNFSVAVNIQRENNNGDKKKLVKSTATADVDAAAVAAAVMLCCKLEWKVRTVADKICANCGHFEFF